MHLEASVNTSKKRKETIRKNNTESNSFETISLNSLNNENELILEKGSALMDTSINMKFKKYHELVIQTEQEKIKQLLEDNKVKTKEVELLKNSNEVLKEKLKKERRLWRMMMLEIFQK